MQKLYVAMVGLPARGKSTLAKRIRDGLMTEGIAARLFNNGDMRRALIGAESTDPNFYDPNNKLGREAREMICMRNMEQAREWLAREGEVAILDATNVSRAHRSSSALCGMRQRRPTAAQCLHSPQNNPAGIRLVYRRSGPCQLYEAHKLLRHHLRALA